MCVHANVMAHISISGVHIYLNIYVISDCPTVFNSVSCIVGLYRMLIFLFSLAFSVTIFCSEAIVAIIILLIRRSKPVGGELGGPKVFKYITSVVLVVLWLVYLLLASLEAYGVIKGF
jgi:hypothetical protein